MFENDQSVLLDLGKKRPCFVNAAGSLIFAQYRRRVDTRLLTYANPTIFISKLNPHTRNIPLGFNLLPERQLGHKSKFLDGMLPCTGLDIFKLWRIVHMFDPIEQEVAVNPPKYTFLPTAPSLVKHELRFVCFHVNWVEFWGRITDELENYGFRIDCILLNQILIFFPSFLLIEN